MSWYYSSKIISHTFAPQFGDCSLDPLYLINMLEKTKHTWFPTQKNTTKTYITDSRNVLPSCARGKVNRFTIHIKISLSLSLSRPSLSAHYLVSLEPCNEEGDEWEYHAEDDSKISHKQHSVHINLKAITKSGHLLQTCYFHKQSTI